MRNILKIIGSSIIVLFLIIWGIWTNYNDFRSLFRSKRKDYLVLCTEFKTENNRLKPLVEKINEIEREKIIKSDITCDKIEILNTDFNTTNDPDVSIIWGLYEKVLNYNLRNYNLSNFLIEFYSHTISPKEQKIIINEIRNWANNSQTPEDLRVFINERAK